MGICDAASRYAPVAIPGVSAIDRRCQPLLRSPRRCRARWLGDHPMRTAHVTADGPVSADGKTYTLRCSRRASEFVADRPSRDRSSRSGADAQIDRGAHDSPRPATKLRFPASLSVRRGHGALERDGGEGRGHEASPPMSRNRPSKRATAARDPADPDVGKKKKKKKKRRRRNRQLRREQAPTAPLPGLAREPRRRRAPAQRLWGGRRSFPWRMMSVPPAHPPHHRGSRALDRSPKSPNRPRRAELRDRKGNRYRRGAAPRPGARAPGHCAAHHGAAAHGRLRGGAHLAARPDRGRPPRGRARPGPADGAPLRHRRPPRRDGGRAGRSAVAVLRPPPSPREGARRARRAHRQDHPRRRQGRRPHRRLASRPGQPDLLPLRGGRRLRGDVRRARRRGHRAGAPHPHHRRRRAAPASPPPTATFVRGDGGLEARSAWRPPSSPAGRAAPSGPSDR